MPRRFAVCPRGLRGHLRTLGLLLSVTLAIPLCALADDIAVFIAAPAAQAQPAQPAAPSGKPDAEKRRLDPNLSMLYLSDEDYFAGKLCDNPHPNTIRWQAYGATEAFEFGPEAVRSAYFAPPAVRPVPKGEYCIELTQGDILCGSLTAITKDAYEIDSSEFGHLKIARAEVQRLTPIASNAFTYRGPNNLVEWTSDDIGQWREEAGRLVANKRGAAIKKSLKIPEQARFEFEIAWDKTPQFCLAFASSDQPRQLAEAYRLEVWGRKLVLVREVSKSADVASVGELDQTTAHIHLEALYNHTTGEFVVKSLDGRELGKITMPKKGGYPLRIISLTNNGKELSLEQLTVSEWSGRLAPKVDLTKPRVQKTDDTIIYGDVTGYSAATKEFIVTADGKETRVTHGELACIVVPPVTKQVPQGPVTADDKETPAGGGKLATIVAPAIKPSPKAPFRVGLHDGSRFSGDLAKLENGKLFLQRRGIDRPLACLLPTIRSIVSFQRSPASAPYTKERTGRLELVGVRSYGIVVADTPDLPADASCLLWKPRWSKTASPLRSDISGRIVYREPPPPPKEGQPEEQQQRPRRGVFWGAVTTALRVPAPVRTPQMPRGAGTLCLVTGDRIPCESIQIDEEGVHFTSSTVAADFVPHKSIKALEFVPRWTAAALAEAKRTRLLTLPRMQKSSPPTHLIASTAGDFLRCRLQSMNADTVSVEVRLENKTLRRDKVGCIIWLHEDEKPKDEKAESEAAPTNQPPARLEVQAVQSDGIRLTFSPKDCDGATLAGVGDVLGTCRVRLSAVDMLLLGRAIEETAETLAYGKWKLKDAIEPEFAREGADPSKSVGSESILLNKPAPDFALDLLDGKHFKLSEHKGQVVVLDFWATWCGPCMMAMPEVHKLLQGYKDRNVEYIAVNMQEEATAVKSVLERIKIEPTVALDIDGAAGERYQVSSIPQIVVIDGEQNIVDLMVGVNPGYLDQLKASVEKALEPKKKATELPKKDK
jgi:thiol-disulfide isomerase/thioredoxin